MFRHGGRWCDVEKISRKRRMQLGKERRVTDWLSLLPFGGYSKRKQTGNTITLSPKRVVVGGDVQFRWL